VSGVLELQVGSVQLALADEEVSRLAEKVAACLEERDRWVTVEGLMHWLGCSRRRVYDLRAKGMPARLVGKRLFFNLREVSCWLAAMEAR
jgi:hypothetical protein